VLLNSYWRAYKSCTNAVFVRISFIGDPDDFPYGLYEIAGPGMLDFEYKMRGERKEFFRGKADATRTYILADGITEFLRTFSLVTQWTG